jgi:hypothetical protein
VEYVVTCELDACKSHFLVHCNQWTEFQEILYWAVLLKFVSTFQNLVEVGQKYKEESINRSQMDIKCKTCNIRTWKNHFISWHVLHQHLYTCPIALPMCRNPRYRSLLTLVSATSAPSRVSSATLECLERISRPNCKPLYATNAFWCQETFLYTYHVFLVSGTNNYGS